MVKLLIRSFFFGLLLVGGCEPSADSKPLSSPSSSQSEPFVHGQYMVEYLFTNGSVQKTETIEGDKMTVDSEGVYLWWWRTDEEDWELIATFPQNRALVRRLEPIP